MHFYPVAEELVSSRRHHLLREAESRRLAAVPRRARKARRKRT